MKLKDCILYTVFLLIHYKGRTQELPIPIQQQLERSAEVTQSETPYDDGYIQDLAYYKKHPVNLNTVSAETIKSLHLLSEIQITNLINYRRLLGKLVDLYELQSIPGWDLWTIKNILPYIYLGSATTIKENLLARLKGEQQLLLELSRVVEKSRGYDTAFTNHFLGDPYHIALRYTNRYKDLFQLGITASKDPGEPFLKGAQSAGFDFYSFHFFIRKLGIIKDLAIGDYSVNLGQGLIQWQSYGFGKSPQVLSIKKESPVLMPYRSMNEMNYKRGFGITLQKGYMEATLFGSVKRISGHIVTDTTDLFTSFYNAGLHRTSSEIADKNKIQQISMGGNISYLTGALKIGLNMSTEHFSIPFQKRDAPYNHFDFKGKNLENASLDYVYTYKNVHFFGEGAIDQFYHKALISGALISLDPKIDVALVYRNISQEYQSLFGKAFTENGQPVNENGLYMGISIKPSGIWQISAYADHYRHPWLTYRVNAPVSGYDYFFQVHYQPDKQFDLFVSFRNQNKPVDSTGAVINFPQINIHKQLQVYFNNHINRSLVVKTRFEVLWNNNEQNNEGGFLAFIEGGYKISPSLKADLRVQYFETPGGNNIIYSSTNDLSLSPTIPSFFDKGVYYYINWDVDVTEKLGLWLQWSRTIYANKNSIGSGSGVIQGNRKSEFKIELHYKL